VISPRVSAVARGITAASGLAVVLISAAVAGEIRSATGHNSTYGDVSAWFALLEILVGVGLLGAALILLSERSTAMLGVLALATAAAWFAPVWVGWQGGPEPLRGVGLVTAPLLPAAVLAVISGVPPRITSAGRMVLLVLVAAGIPAMFAASIALTVVRDPIRDPYCWSDCTASAFVVHDDPGLARRLVSLVLLLGAATGGLAAAAGAIRFARAASVTRRGSGPALAAASLAGITLAAYAISLHYVPHEVPSRPLYAGLFVARALALLALAFGLAWLALRPRIVRGLVTRLVVDLERSAAEGGLGRLLARALGDPQLRLGYPLGSATERIVDAEGHPLTFHPARHVTPIVGDEGVVALVESDATTADALGRELGPAVHLALGNERLRAEALARLADVTESRARIVETADAARLRMERDLHDGAQQRMLALTYDLRVALTAAEAAGNEPAAVPLRTALNRAAAASGELREIAHGVYPAELKASGLEAALQSLADLHALRLVLRLPAGRRYSSEIEAAAYAVVAEALEAAEGPVVATVSESDGRLRLEVEGVGVWGDHLVYVEDRIGAAGGEVTAEQQRLDVSLPGSPA
jgi:signal transduction histidine kinase